jgi:hypothetical protein
VDDRHCNDIMLVVHSKMHMAVHEIHSKWIFMSEATVMDIMTDDFNSPHMSAFRSK